MSFSSCGLQYTTRRVPLRVYVQYGEVVIPISYRSMLVHYAFMFLYQMNNTSCTHIKCIYVIVLYGCHCFMHLCYECLAIVKYQCYAIYYDTICMICYASTFCIFILQMLCVNNVLYIPVPNNQYVMHL